MDAETLTATTPKGTVLTVRRELPTLNGRFLFACDCGWTAARAGTCFAVAYKRRSTDTTTTYGQAIRLTDPDPALPPTWLLINPAGHLVIACPAPGCRVLDRPANKPRTVIGQRVRGVPSSHECNAKCVTARGPHCECKCRGENHGNAFAGVTFSAAPPTSGNP